MKTLVSDAREKAAGAIIFRQLFEGREFLVIRSSREKCEVAPHTYVADFWEFPKGRIEHGERGEDAARREVEEETGLSEVEFMPDFNEKLMYTIYREGNAVEKEVVMYLGRAESNEVLLSREHRAYEWLSYDDARRRVSVEEMRRALVRAGEYLDGI